MISTRNLVESLNKKYKLNESFVEEWWGQTEEDPYEFAYKYGLTCAKLGKRNDEILYRFSGEKEDIEAARNAGYFYSIDYGADEGHSDDLDESLTDLEESQELNENPAVIAPIVAAAAPSIAKMGADVINHAVDKLTEEEPITEDYKDARGTDIYYEVLDWVQTKIDDFAGQIPVQDLSVEVEGYNPDWCAQDGGESSVRALEKIQLEFAKALTDTYFEHYGE